MDLTFEVPMEYCPLQCQTLLSPPEASTTEPAFCFGSASSFLLEPFLHSSPVAYWTPTDLGWGVHLSLSFPIFFHLFVFSYCSWGSQGKNAEVVCHSLLQRYLSSRTFCHEQEFDHDYRKVVQVKNLPAHAGNKTCRFDPWVRKIPWKKAWQPTLICLPRESHG